MKAVTRKIFRRIKLIPTLASLLTLLVSLVLVVLQFTGIYPLNEREQLSVMLILLILISGTLLIERFSVLQEILDKTRNKSGKTL